MAMTPEQEEIWMKIQLDVKAALDKLHEFFAAVQDYEKRVRAYNDAVSELMTKWGLSYEYASSQIQKMNAELEKFGKTSMLQGASQTRFLSETKKQSQLGEIGVDTEAVKTVDMLTEALSKDIYGNTSV